VSISRFCFTFGWKRVEILVWTSSPGKKCSSAMVTSERKVNRNILRSGPWLRFPPSLTLLALSSSSPSVSSFALIYIYIYILVWQRNKDLHVVEGEESRLAVQRALVPVLVDLIGQGDDVALSEAQLSLVLWIKVVKRLTARLLRG